MICLCKITYLHPKAQRFPAGFSCFCFPTGPRGGEGLFSRPPYETCSLKPAATDGDERRKFAGHETKCMGRGRGETAFSAGLSGTGRLGDAKGDESIPVPTFAGGAQESLLLQTADLRKSLPYHLRTQAPQSKGWRGSRRVPVRPQDVASVLERVPALRLQPELPPVPAYEHAPQVGFGDTAYHLDVIYPAYFVVVGKGDGE